jgi:hypothetical protein
VFFGQFSFHFDLFWRFLAKNLPEHFKAFEASKAVQMNIHESEQSFEQIATSLFRNLKRGTEVPFDG